MIMNRDKLAKVEESESTGKEGVREHQPSITESSPDFPVAENSLSDKYNIDDVEVRGVNLSGNDK